MVYFPSKLIIVVLSKRNLYEELLNGIEFIDKFELWKDKPIWKRTDKFY